MAILDVYSNQSTVYAPADTQTYGDFVFDMQRSGINDLVAKDKVDPTFRPPQGMATYSETVFKKNLAANQL